MSLFDTVKKAVTQTAKDAAKVSGDLVEQTKLKLKAMEIRDEVESRYEKIGELYYATVEYELDCGEKIESLVSEVKALKEELEVLDAEIRKSKKVVKCSVCNEENDMENIYCSQCGNKLN